MPVDVAFANIQSKAKGGCGVNSNRVDSRQRLADPRTTAGPHYIANVTSNNHDIVDTPATSAVAGSDGNSNTKATATGGSSDDEPSTSATLIAVGVVVGLIVVGAAIFATKKCHSKSKSADAVTRNQPDRDANAKKHQPRKPQHVTCSNNPTYVHVDLICVFCSQGYRWRSVRLVP